MLVNMCQCNRQSDAVILLVLRMVTAGGEGGEGGNTETVYGRQDCMN
jgi:hypothetical protein